MFFFSLCLVYVDVFQLKWKIFLKFSRKRETLFCIKIWESERLKIYFSKNLSFIFSKNAEIPQNEYRTAVKSIFIKKQPFCLVSMGLCQCVSPFCVYVYILGACSLQEKHSRENKRIREFWPILLFIFCSDAMEVVCRWFLFRPVIKKLQNTSHCFIDILFFYLSLGSNIAQQNLNLIKK